MKYRPKKKFSRFECKPLSLLLPQPGIVSDSSDFPSPPGLVRYPDRMQPATACTSHSETNKWGWILLFLTWLVFVIGAGGIFGVWDWAFEKVDLPNSTIIDFEDRDDVFIMPGYYPILIILSGGVTAWIWVVMNWMGLKFFRHN